MYRVAMSSSSHRSSSHAGVAISESHFAVTPCTSDVEPTAPATVVRSSGPLAGRARFAALAVMVALAAGCSGEPAADTATATSATATDATSSPAAAQADDSPEASPGDDGPADAATFEPGTATFEAGGQRYDLSLDNCFASPQDGVQVTGTSAAGEQMTADFKFDSPEQASVYLTSSDGEALWTSNDEAGPPEFEVEPDGSAFAVRGTFVNPDGTEIDGSLSGSC